MKTIIIITLTFALFSCSNKSNDFSKEIELIESEYNIDKENIALIERIICNDSILIVFDYHSGKSYTIFDIKTGRCLGRFGDIGQGPNELIIGSPGYLENNKFTVFHAMGGYIRQYNTDSLLTNIDIPSDKLADFRIRNSFFTQIIPLNDSLFLGVGAYLQENIYIPSISSTLQFAIFNSNNMVINANILTYNFNESLNFYHKALSNQGRLCKSPKTNKFAYTLNYSSNIDFIEINDNKINEIKLYRKRNPQLIPSGNGENSFIRPDLKNKIGYIDVTCGEEFVYALHSDKLVTEEYSSNIIYKFDWNGNPVKKYKLSRDVYFITVNENINKLYAVIKDTDSGWNITTYDLE